MTRHFFTCFLAYVLFSTPVLVPTQARADDLGLGRVEQISLTVSDIRRAEHFYEDQLGLRKLLAQDNLLIFDLAGQRLLLGTAETAKDGNFSLSPSATVYLRCADLAICRRELESRGVRFSPDPEFAARQPTYDLWLLFFQDPDGNNFALMSESPRGYNPVTGVKADN